MTVLGQILKELREIKKLLGGQRTTISRTYKPMRISAEELERIARAEPGDVVKIGEAPQT